MRLIPHILSLLALTIALPLAATEISNLPVEGQTLVKPNVIFALDDSGSMDYEVLFKTNDGALWWEGTSKSYVDNAGNPYYNQSGTTGSRDGQSWNRTVYLFPNGIGGDARSYRDNTMDAIAPVPENAFTRSPDYNSIYYNPRFEYKPWAPAYIGDRVVTFTNSNPQAARSHPARTSNGSITTLDLTHTLFSKSSSWTFRMRSGMVIPGASISGIEARRVGSRSWNQVNNNYTISGSEVWDVAIPYYPATYYLLDRSCNVGSDCFVAPDGGKLRRYEIKPGNSFPSGRNYVEEMQNFANWFTYYRKRKLLLSSALGDILNSVTGLRAGITLFNNGGTVRMYDFADSDPSRNSKALLGKIYTNPSSGTTPTRNTLNRIGRIFAEDEEIIQYACQANSTMVLTDGFANVSDPNVPDYDRQQWGGVEPYTPIFDQSLADIALAYYTINPRPDLDLGLVPNDPLNEVPGADRNQNLHINTYAFNLGSKGTIYGTDSPEAQDPFTYPPIWPEPNQTRNPTAVDDLWHATINGRGLMLNAADLVSAQKALETLIADVLSKAGTGAAVAVSNTFLTTENNIVYLASYKNGYGNLEAVPVDLNTGMVQTNHPIWSAQSQLDGRTPDSRIIASYNGSSGIPFQWQQLSSSMQTDLHSDSIEINHDDGEDVLQWLRGDRTLEGDVYRTRLHLLGDIVYAEPKYVQGAISQYVDEGYSEFRQAVASRPAIIYQAANDGMLHAFSADTGMEKWAYVPRLLFPKLNQLAAKNYTHKFYVDGTPTVADIEVNDHWRTILVGGLRAGGNGYYALDITNPEVAVEADLAHKVMWEFDNIGLSFGKPLVVKTEARGWVVLVTSGYNNYAGDGKGHLFVLDPVDGSLIKDIATTAGSSSDPSGLAQISAFAENQLYDATVEFVYGGDLQGNVWRFNLGGESVADWDVTLLATLVDSNGEPQPITTEAELSQYKGNRVIYIGTGKLLGSNDVMDTQQQTMYALVDDLSSAPTITDLKNELVGLSLQGNMVVGDSVDYAVHKGWYIDLPGVGERINVDPVLAFGSLVFNTNQPSPDACTSASFQYIVDQFSGKQIMPANAENETEAARTKLGNTLTSKPVIVVLPNKKVVTLSHKSDSSVTEVNVLSQTSSNARAVAWGEILNN